MAKKIPVPTTKYSHCNHHHKITKEQKFVTIGNSTFVADRELIRLLTALNDMGLKTVSHCCGHTTGVSWVRLSTKNINNIEIRKYEESLIISWKKPKRKRRV